MQRSAKIWVYTDGKCELCLRARRFVERFDVSKDFEFLDYNAPVVAGETPYGPAELAREMHVRLEDGRWFAGYDGWIAVLRVLPRWRWLALVGALPPFGWIGPFVYRLIAANRYRIARWLTARSESCEHCDVPLR